jgi:hypothetical protein
LGWLQLVLQFLRWFSLIFQHLSVPPDIQLYSANKDVFLLPPR